VGKGPRAGPEPRRSRGMKVAVVGGGLAGLAAAIACADGGAEGALYEARSRLGGATFSLERSGRGLENGPHAPAPWCTPRLPLLPRFSRGVRARSPAPAAAAAGGAGAP